MNQTKSPSQEVKAQAPGEAGDQPFQERRSLSAIDRILADGVSEAILAADQNRVQSLLDSMSELDDPQMIDRVFSIVASRVQRPGANIEVIWQRGTEVRNGVARPFLLLEIEGSRRIGSYRVTFQSDTSPTFTASTDQRSMPRNVQETLRRMLGD